MKYLTAVIQYIVRVISRPIFAYFFNFEVSGLENIPEDVPVVFASNHPSKLDPFLLQAALPLTSRHIPLYFVAREKKFYKSGLVERIFYGGWFFKMLGAYPAYNGKRDYEHSLREHVILLNNEHSVCIYPEGGLTRNGHKNKSRGGVGFLAAKTGVPAVSVHIDGIDNLTWKDFWFRRRTVRIVFGEPQYFSDEQPLVEKFKDFSRTIVDYIYELKERV